MDIKDRPATMRALAVAFTILEVCVAAAAIYHTLAGNTIALAAFWLLAIVGLFVTAATWGADFDNRREPDMPQVSPNDLHDLVEVDYASLLRVSRAQSLVVTLRPEAPYARIEAINNGWRSDWIVDGDSMFETYIKAWIRANETNDEPTR